MSDKTLPASWAMVPLKELARSRMGKTILKSDLTESGLPVYSAGASTEPWGFLEGCEVSYGPETLVISARGNIGMPKRPRQTPFVCTQTTIACSSYLPETVGWLFWFLSRYDYSKKSSQTTIPMLRTSDVDSFEVPLPPLPEQKRIVAKIEELFSGLEAGEESLRLVRRQLGVYRQSLLKQAFEGKLTAKWRTQNPAKLESPATLLAHLHSERETRYVQLSGAKAKKLPPLTPFPSSELVGDFAIPESWLVLSYGDLCSVIRNGISQKPTGDSGHKIARISAVRPMVFDYDDYRFIDCADKFAAAFTLAPGDLIFTRYNGARRYVGVCAQFKGHEPRLYPDKLIRTRPDLPSLDPRYLEIALNCGLSRAWLETKIRTTAGQSGVSGGDVKAMPVPLCSLPEQKEIVRVLDEQFEGIERNEREIDGALRSSEALRQAILQKAFTGCLVPQEPSDEQASDLLTRLRAERDATHSLPRVSKHSKPTDP